MENDDNGFDVTGSGTAEDVYDLGTIVVTGDDLGDEPGDDDEDHGDGNGGDGGGSTTSPREVDLLGCVDKRDSHRALGVIQAGICNGDELGTRFDDRMRRAR